MTEIQSSFGDRVISKGLWPPRSPLSDAAWFFLISERRSLPKQTTNHRRLESKHYRRHSGRESERTGKDFQ